MRDFLKDTSIYCQLLRTGRPSILTARKTGGLLNFAAEGNNSCDELRKDLQLQVSKWTIQRVLKNSGFLLYSEMKSASFMTPKHKKFRLE